MTISYSVGTKIVETEPFPETNDNVDRPARFPF